MAIIKCKMCGGDLNLVEGASTAECEFCGSVQTVPKVDDEKKLTLFARGNRLRTACEFDKAAGIYESIVADFPEEAEAYWGLVLCKYGIEYVDDPATGKKIPTCHRSSFDSIMEDSDFEQALENADGAARKVYREEAKQIEELRKNIIAVSNNEQPYDLFICYKETDDKGDRTLDSVLAQDIYDALTDKGYRVFFARITLEDKLGQEYEPYIFAALNSAKIMLAVGTDYEYYNAVWVKNEWSRFLKLMAKDKAKHLIPCFKGIDAYDMPKEFAKLQAQDLGKVGAVQDLMRGIAKLLPQEKSSVTQDSIAIHTSGSGTAPLLERAYIFLEDKYWDSANEYCEKVLDLEPQNASAYLIKLMANLHISQEEQLQDCGVALSGNNNYKKAIRFGEPALVQKIENYAHNNKNALLKRAQEALLLEEWARADNFYNHLLTEDPDCLAAYIGKLLVELKINTPERIAVCNIAIWETSPNYPHIMRLGDAETINRFEMYVASIKESLEELTSAKTYEKATSMVIGRTELTEIERIYGLKPDNQPTEKELLAAAALLDTIPNYRDAKILAVNFRQKAEDFHLNNIYRRALFASGGSSPEQLMTAIQLFESIPNYKDSQKEIERCKEKLQAQATLIQQRNYRSQNRCQYCGGDFKGIFSKICVHCGKSKDY